MLILCNIGTQLFRWSVNYTAERILLLTFVIPLERGLLVVAFVSLVVEGPIEVIFILR